MSAQRTFFAELKRRNVPRAVVLYAGAVWALAQGIAQLGPFFGAPGWVVRWFVIACVIGLPFWIAFAWFYQITLHGIRREPEIEAAPAATRALARKLDYWIIGILAVAVVLLVTNTFVLHRDVNSKAAAMNANAIAAALAKVPAKSIAVLPFENLSDDKKNEYFVAGMQDLILTKLADIGDLKVIARTSTEHYASHPENLSQIAAQLGVATLLEGSVQKSGQQVLINVQLIDARTDAHIWAQAYTRNLDNIFGVEGEVAGKIANALNAKLSPTASRQIAVVPTTNPAAYDLFLRADYQANRGNTNIDTAVLAKAVALYRQAVAKDPAFALAWGRLSWAESMLAYYGGGGADLTTINQRARADAERALQLAPDLPASQLALGYSDYAGQLDFPGALKAFNAVLLLRPNDTQALTARASVQLRLGHFKAGIAALTQAVVHDPRNSMLAGQLGWANMLVGRYDAAGTWLRRALALDPHNVTASITLSNVILFTGGDVGRALTAVQGDAPHLKLQRVNLLVYQRRYRQALALLPGIPDHTLNNFSIGSQFTTLQAANLYRLLGNMTQARSRFARILPTLRARLDAQHQKITRAYMWDKVASAELGLGHTQAGLAAIAQARANILKTGGRVYRPKAMLFNATLYAEAKRPDLAVPLLDKTLATPGIGWVYAPVLLWLDPAWDPIRKDPRFQALLAKYVKDKPVRTNGPPASAIIH